MGHQSNICSHSTRDMLRHQGWCSSLLQPNDVHTCSANRFSSTGFAFSSASEVCVLRSTAAALQDLPISLPCNLDINWGVLCGMYQGRSWVNFLERTSWAVIGMMHKQAYRYYRDISIIPGQWKKAHVQRYLEGYVGRVPRASNKWQMGSGWRTILDSSSINNIKSSHQSRHSSPRITLFLLQARKKEQSPRDILPNDAQVYVILASSTICLELTTVLETSNAHVQLLELGRHGRLALEPTAMDLIMANMDRGNIWEPNAGWWCFRSEKGFPHFCKVNDYESRLYNEMILTRRMTIVYIQSHASIANSLWH